MAKKLPTEFLKRIEAVTNKQARIVLDHIAKNGSITTEELKNIGYEHPPRARMDALDLGFPIVTKRVKNSVGKSIGAYSFDLSRPLDDPSRMGRLALPKLEREAILDKAERKCQLCGAEHDLQVDHRVPYQVAGEALKDSKEPYMVLCGSCNRKKSWPASTARTLWNQAGREVPIVLLGESREPHACRDIAYTSRGHLIWQGEETRSFDDFRSKCKNEGKSIEAGIKEMMRSRK